MKILVSNDDGVYATGINALAEALQEVAEVQIVAPDRDRSGASNSLSLTRPLRTKTLHNGAISVEGTPTDCVHLALTGLIDFVPDLVVSGINDGSNLGDDIVYSGTVAAAMEGGNFGIPSIAVSMVRKVQTTHFETGAQVVKQLIEHINHHPLPARTILNVNVPDLPLANVGEWQVTRLGARHNAKPLIKDTDQQGGTIYWIGPAGAEQDGGPGTDFHAVNQGDISITPLHIDLTHYNAFAKLTGWIQGMQS